MKSRCFGKKSSAPVKLSLGVMLVMLGCLARVATMQARVPLLRRGSSLDPLASRSKQNIAVRVVRDLTTCLSGYSRNARPHGLHMHVLVTPRNSNINYISSIGKELIPILSENVGGSQRSYAHSKDIGFKQDRLFMSMSSKKLLHPTHYTHGHAICSHFGTVVAGIKMQP